MPTAKLKAVLRGMIRPRRGLSYYQMNVVARPDGQIIRSAYTEWVGFTKSTPEREIREGSLVRTQYFTSKWKEFAIPYVVVSTPPQLIAYLFIGGNALVEKALAEEHFPDLVLAHEVIPDGPPGSGFKGVRSLPQESFFRRPRPKLRMKVLKRDDYRCKICGRRSSDHSDIELDVHHIRPWATGGITAEQNLITLCHTCHAGLAPHEEIGLFGLLKESSASDQSYELELELGMLRYQSLVREAYQKLEAVPPRRGREAKRARTIRQKTIDNVTPRN